MTKTFQIIEDLKDFDKKDFENLWWTLISQVEEDLAEDYKNTLLIHHCKGDEMDLPRRRKLQKNLKEEYLTMLMEMYSIAGVDTKVFCDMTYKRGPKRGKLVGFKTFTEGLFKKAHSSEFFLKCEQEINWDMFDRNGQCINNAKAEYDHNQDFDRPVRELVRCKNQGKFTCSKCKKVSYCSKECSIQYWRYHKTICNAITEIASEVD